MSQTAHTKPMVKPRRDWSLDRTIGVWVLIYVVANLLLLFIFSLPILWILACRTLEADRGAPPPWSLSAIGVSQNLIAFESRATGNGDIYVFDVSNRTVRRVTTSSAREGYPKIDADSGTVVFSRFTTTGCCLVRSVREGQTERQMTTPGVGESDYASRIEQRGQTVHFDRMSAYGAMATPSEEWICEGENPPRIPTFLERSRSYIPQPHPDLPILAFENGARNFEKPRILSVNVDGTTTEVCDGTLIDLSSNGTRLLIEKESGEWSVMEWKGGKKYETVFQGKRRRRPYEYGQVTLSSDGTTVLSIEPDSVTILLYDVDTRRVSNRIVEDAESIGFADIFDEMLLLTARDDKSKRMICVFPNKLTPARGTRVYVNSLEVRDVLLKDGSELPKDASRSK